MFQQESHWRQQPLRREALFPCHSQPLRLWGPLRFQVDQPLRRQLLWAGPFRQGCLPTWAGEAHWSVREEPHSLEARAPWQMPSPAGHSMLRSLAAWKLAPKTQPTTLAP